MDFNKLPAKQQLCIACSKCCKEVGIYTHPGMYTCTEEELIDFYQAKGFIVTKEGEYLVLTLKMSCPHLTPIGCDIYEKRPQVCRDYSGIDDFGKECYWSILPEHKKKPKRKKAGSGKDKRKR